MPATEHENPTLTLMLEQRSCATVLADLRLRANLHLSWIWTPLMLGLMIAGLVTASSHPRASLALTLGSGLTALLSLVVLFRLMSDTTPALPRMIEAALRYVDPRDRQELLKRIDGAPLRKNDEPVSIGQLLCHTRCLRWDARERRRRERKLAPMARRQAALIDAYRAV